ncbi:EAL domain-containing protein [Aliivibrio kagoshimensis]|uniref:putative bifunctional diguanylate cyclase/phosphodiesterase n=1 Tax=Aliivibrio kagoshimensis TaxID=2910230 RepID=UPI003D0E593B
MNLSKRLIVLIIPVILLSYGLVTYKIFNEEKSAIQQLEKQKIALGLSELASYHSYYLTFLNSYVYALKESGTLQEFIHNSDDQYRHIDLSESLDRALSELDMSHSAITSVSLLSPQLQTLFYYESSQDPFAKQPQEQKEFVQHELNALQNQKSGLVTNQEGQTSLIRYMLIDTRTLSTAEAGQVDHTLALTVTIEAQQLNLKIMQMNGYYQTEVTFSDSRVLPHDSQAHTVALNNNTYLFFKPNAHYLDSKISSLFVRLISGFLLLIITSTATLLILIRHYVINPVCQLDKQLNQLDCKAIENLTPSGKNDEVGRLSRKFHNMYSELNAAYLKSKQLAENDQLTQLANRYRFNNEVENQLNHCDPDTHKISIIYIDLDNFKTINDQYGHTIGDQLLADFSEQLTLLIDNFSSTHRQYCIAARLSGDEFAIAITSERLGQQLESKLSATIISWFHCGYRFKNNTLPVTASIGIACFPDNGVDLDQLISKADTAMYQAKKLGKNQLFYYSQQLDQEMQRIQQIEKELRTHNFDDIFNLVYMPYVHASNKQLIGFEALLRWSSPTLGLVSPDEFIPITEKIGLYASIDRWVLKNAMSYYHTLAQIVGFKFQLSINLSSANLNSINLANYIIQISEQYRITPELIELELTETFDASVTQYSLLCKLNEYGFQLAIDDFGSGFTSMTQLAEYPVQKIKLDRVFLNTLSNSKKRQIIKPLIELCHSQSMIVTAEGIETEEMSRWLSDFQCDLLQGYYYGKPMALNEIPQWLSDYERRQINENSDYLIAKPS